MMAERILAGNVARVRGRGRILRVLETDSLLTRIVVLGGNKLSLETRNWDSYWQPLYKLEHEKVEEKLKAFYCAWSGYISSGFQTRLMQEYCFRYFVLLRAVLSVRLIFDNTAWLEALHTLLGFECFGIASSTTEPAVLAAGTCTMRNPCYLLAKLQKPGMLDNSRYLPMITVAGTRPPELFFHYRQYTLSPDSPISLLLYPAVAEKKRPASFKMLNSLADIVRHAADPWTAERTKQLLQGIIYPLIQTTKSIEHPNTFLEFVDIGAGSGSLSARLCSAIRKMKAATGLNPRFRLWSVDLSVTDPARFFKNNRLKSRVDSLMYVGDDYRNWLDRAQPLPSTSNLRIALISKLLDVMSHFYILFLSRQRITSDMPRDSLFMEYEKHVPVNCLAPDGKGAEELVMCHSRLCLPEGNGYMQISLSEFFMAMSLLSTTKIENSTGKGIYLPVRSFAPECLTTSNGDSVISCLAKHCDYIVIEDADLAPANLIAHAEAYSLSPIGIYDMSKTLKLKGNYCYLIWSKEKMPSPSVTGKRIW